MIVEVKYVFYEIFQIHYSDPLTSCFVLHWGRVDVSIT